MTAKQKNKLLLKNHDLRATNTLVEPEAHIGVIIRLTRLIRLKISLNRLNRVTLKH